MTKEIYKYDTREITYGNQRAAYSTIDIDEETGLMTFAKPKELTGLVSVEFNKSKNATNIYADDTVHMSLSGEKQVSGNIVFYQIEKDFFLKHLGHTLQENGLITDTGETKNFVFQYIETVHDQFGKETPKLHIYYNINAGAPTGGSTTKTDQVNAKQFTLPMTALPNSNIIDAQTGEQVTEATLLRTSENANFFDRYMEGVLIPNLTEGAQAPIGAILDASSPVTAAPESVLAVSERKRGK